MVFVVLEKQVIKLENMKETLFLTHWAGSFVLYPDRIGVEIGTCPGCAQVAPANVHTILVDQDWNVDSGLLARFWYDLDQFMKV